ncbi:MAG: FkbM family methyltransferase, partial [Pseudomonadales bacterium]
MSLIKRWLRACLRRLVPLTRWWINSIPLPPGKRFILKNFSRLAFKFKTKTQYNFSIEGSTEDLIQKYIYYFGVWEPNLSDVLYQRFKTLPTRHFIDIGANIGYFSLLAAKTLAPPARVIAIEAHPQIHAHLSRNISRNSVSNIQAIHAAVLDRQGEVSLFDGPKGNTGSSTILPSRFAQSSAQPVPASPLGLLVDNETLKHTGTIKIDVEGAEVQVVKGLADVMDHLPQDIIFTLEITPELIGLEGRDYIFQFFESRGFQAYAIQNSYDPETYWNRPPAVPP